MKILNIRTTLSAVLLTTLGLGVGLVHAMGTKPDPATKQSQEAGAFQQSISWYDGDRKKTAWLNPGLVAEFAPKSDSGSAVKQALPGAREVSVSQASLRMWEAETAGVDLAITLKTRNPIGNYSPVWHDGRGAEARKRALPGGILVTFNPNWKAEQVAEWAARQGLVMERALGFGNIYLFKTEAGMAALETANRIHESGEVVSASPNWWKEVVTR